jgi:cell division septation protein DedD
VVATSPNSPDSALEIKRLESLQTAESKKADTALTLLTKRLADAEAQSQKQNSRLEELSTALSEIRSTLKDKKNAPAASSVALPPAEGAAPTQGDLTLLKERNRLTSYADEAIATGARAPYEKIWEALDDPRLSNLANAARAEILRVQNFYLGGSRLERYDIPVATYFPEQSALRDSQLKDEQLIKLLREKKNPWEVRMKAANLLGMRRSLDAGDALVETVKTDDNLDVVKEATFSFEQVTGFHARLFDAASLAQWWKEFKATPPPPQPKAKTKAKAKTDGKPSETEAKKSSPSASPKNQEKEKDAEKKKP